MYLSSSGVDISKICSDADIGIKTTLEPISLMSGQRIKLPEVVASRRAELDGDKNNLDRLYAWLKKEE